MSTEKISVFIPVYNQFKYIESVLKSISLQKIVFSKILIIDDGSKESLDLDILKEFKDLNISYLKNKNNKGRGYCRYIAVQNLDSDLILMLDGSNCLPKNFVKSALSYFISKDVSAVSGLIHNDPCNANVVSKWRGRHLFKQDFNFGSTVHNAESLTTYGTILRRTAVLDVGNFNPTLRHSEDRDLGKRLLNNGYKIIGDPNLVVYSIKKDSIFSILERYWRWYGGEDESMSFYDYLIAIKASIRPMIQQDLTANDFKSAFISLLCPHYGYCRYLLRKITGKIQNRF